MIFEGDKSVIDALREKKRLVDAGLPHSHLKLLLVIDGGLMKGAYGAGAAIAFEELQLISCCEALVGISSGAATVAYMLSGNTTVGASVLYEECCSRSFRPRFGFKNVIDTAFIERVLAGDTGKSLVFEKIFSHTVPLYIGVSDFLTGTPVLLQSNTKSDLLTSIRASISMPGAVSLPAIVNGVRYVDGASTRPHILNHICETLDATHILIITNQDKGTRHISWIEHFIHSTFFRRRTNAALRYAANWRRESRHEFVEKTLKAPSKPTLFVWGNNSVSSNDTNTARVKDTIEKSRRWWLEQLTQ